MQPWNSCTHVPVWTYSTSRATCELICCHSYTCTDATVRVDGNNTRQSNRQCTSCRVTYMCRASVRGSRMLGCLVDGCMFAASPRRLLGLGAHPILPSLFPYPSVRPVAFGHNEQAMNDVCSPAISMSPWSSSMRLAFRARTPSSAY